MAERTEPAGQAAYRAVMDEPLDQSVDREYVGECAAGHRFYLKLRGVGSPVRVRCPRCPEPAEARLLSGA